MILMLKVTFKEPQRGHVIVPSSDGDTLKVHFEFSDQLKSITPYIPTQDPMLDRSEILKQLGISKEQDDAMQAKYSIEQVKPTDL